MNNFNIYLSGGMSGLSLDEQLNWRNRYIQAIEFSDYKFNYKPIFFNPPIYYNDFEKQHKTDREVMEYDLYNLRKSDLVIVNYNVPNSIGTAMELMLANENNIPIIGLNKDKNILHPWLSECTTRMCDSMRELVDYTIEFFLI